MRKVIRHIINFVFLASMFIAALVIIYFSVPYVRASIDKAHKALSLEREYTAKHLSIGQQVLTVYVADSDAKRTLGLGDRDSLQQNYGMLFVFPISDYYSFWMQDMKFPIDILWINKDNEIIYMKENVTPDTYPTRFIPPTKATMVLEVNAGFVEKNNIKMGESVTVY